MQPVPSSLPWRGEPLVSTTIFVIDDDEAVRRSLVFRLRAERFTARGFASAAEFLNELHEDWIGCIITDVRMPGMDGITLVQWLRRLDMRLPVIVMTGHGDIPMAVRAMQVGAADFIQKPFTDDDVVRSVRKVLKRFVVSEEVHATRVDRVRRAATLTAREREICDLIVGGQSSKEAALTLNISHRTVENHRASIMTKMGVENVSALVRLMLG